MMGMNFIRYELANLFRTEMVSGLQGRGPEVEALMLPRKSTSQAISESGCQPAPPPVPLVFRYQKSSERTHIALND